MRRIFALVAAVVVLVAGPGAAPALADVRVLSSTPASGATVTRPPDEVRIAFDQAVGDEVSSIQVHAVGAGSLGGNSYADLYNVGLVRTDGSSVLVQSVRVLPPGSYEVAWTVAAGPATPATSGKFQFTVAAPAGATSTAGQWVIIGVIGLVILFLAVSLVRRRSDRRAARS